MSIIIKVHNGFFYKGKAELISGTEGSVIKAKTNATYEILLNSSNDAMDKNGKPINPSPKQVQLEKQGDDLLVSTDDTTFTISDYFLYPESQLVGLGSDSSYYTYLPMQSEIDAFFGRDIWIGTNTEGGYTAALQGQPKSTPWLLEPTAEPMSSYILPVLGGIGASALALAAIEGSKKSGDSSSDNNTPVEAPTANINEQGTQITGTAEAGVSIEVSVESGVIGTAKADSEGKFSVDLTQAQTNGERIQVVAKKGSTTSKEAFVEAPDTTPPEPAANLSISDDGLEVSGEAEEGTRISVLDANGNLLGASVADEKNVFKVALLQAQVGEQPLTVIVTDSGENTSQPAELTGASGENGTISTIIDIDSNDNLVTESAKVGTTVGITAKASDYEDITYTLTDDSGGKFVIDSKTGVVTTAATLDYETAQKHSIGVRAQSADGSFREIEFEVLVSNENDNDVGSLSDSDNTANQVESTAASGSQTGLTASAIDPDGDLVTYSLKDNANGFFAINTDTGNVITAADLTNQSGTFDIVVTATSSDGSTSEGTFSIEIIKGAQAKPVTSSSISNAEVGNIELNDAQPLLLDIANIDTTPVI